MSKNKKAGGKINGSHSTMIDAAVGVVKKAEKCSWVTKISLGIIKQIGSGPRNIKFMPINGGVMAKIRGSVCLQEVYFYTSEPKKLEDLLREDF